MSRAVRPARDRGVRPRTPGQTTTDRPRGQPMSKMAAMLLADTDTREAMGRMANALTVVKEGKEEGDDVRLVLDGAGTKWAPELAKEDHKYHRTWTVQAEGERTLLTSEAEVILEGGRLGRLLEPLMSRQIRRMGRRSLAAV